MTVAARAWRRPAVRYGDVLADHFLGAARRGSVADAIVTLVGVGILAASAQVRIPLTFTPVPISGQTFAVLLIGSALGPRRAAIAGVAYLAVGAAGVPVFSDFGSGFGRLLGPTGGYLIGFAVAAAVLGALARRRADRHVGPAFAAMVLGTIVIYAFGLGGLMLVTGSDLGHAAELGLYPFLIGDLIKAILASLALPAAWAVMRRVEGEN
jgi:biotin transport system substrate-specific component